MNRKLAREFCMKVLFQMSIHNQYDLETVQRELDYLGVDTQQEDYILTLTKAIIDHRSEIDGIIVDFAKGWKLERIAKVDLAILRVAFGEILYMDEIPSAVSINEAIEIGKKYSGDEASAFINGILGKYVEEKGLKLYDK